MRVAWCARIHKNKQLVPAGKNGNMGDGDGKRLNMSERVLQRYKRQETGRPAYRFLGEKEVWERLLRILIAQ
jgi:hypothetical protein